MDTKTEESGRTLQDNKIRDSTYDKDVKAC